MKPNELRIGNFVGYKGEIVKIEEILISKSKLQNLYHVGFYSKNWNGYLHVLLSEISPVSATKDVLLSLGFENRVIDERFHYGFYVYFTNNYHLFQNGHYLGYYEYLHQIQNILNCVDNLELTLSNN